MKKIPFLCRVGCVYVNAIILVHQRGNKQQW